MPAMKKINKYLWHSLNSTVTTKLLVFSRLWIEMCIFQWLGSLNPQGGRQATLSLRPEDYSFDTLQGYGLRAQHKGLHYSGCSRGEHRLQRCQANSQEHASITVDRVSVQAFTVYQQCLITKDKQGDWGNKNTQGPISTHFNTLAKMLSFTKKWSDYPLFCLLIEIPLVDL